MSQHREKLVLSIEAGSRCLEKLRRKDSHFWKEKKKFKEHMQEEQTQKTW